MNKRVIVISGFGVLAAVALQLGAAELPVDLQPLPNLPDTTETSAEDEPVVTIVRKKGATESHYRIRGKLYMIKVTPEEGGASYYLVDEIGNGQFTRRNEAGGRKLLVPQWVLFRF